MVMGKFICCRSWRSVLLVMVFLSCFMFSAYAEERVHEKSYAQLKQNKKGEKKSKKQKNDLDSEDNEQTNQVSNNGPMTLADIASRKQFKGIPKTVSSSQGKNSPPPYELLLPQQKFGNFVLHPKTSMKQTAADALFPPEMAHDIHVMFSQKSKRNWGFVMHTKQNYNPEEYRKKLWQMLDSAFSNSETQTYEALKEAVGAYKGNLMKFIDEATAGNYQQIYYTGDFLAVIYTHPYTRYKEYEKDVDKKCRVWVIYIDVQMYCKASDELPMKRITQQEMD